MVMQDSHARPACEAFTCCSGVSMSSSRPIRLLMMMWGWSPRIMSFSSRARQKGAMSSRELMPLYTYPPSYHRMSTLP